MCACIEKIYERNINLEKIYEIAFLCYVFLYFIDIGNIINLYNSVRTIRGIVVCIAIIRALLLIIRKGFYKYLTADIILLLAFLRIVLICSSNMNVERYLDMLTIAICAFEIDYRKVFQSVSLSFVVSILGSFLCAFTNLVDSSAREYSRTYGDITSTIIRSGWACGHENVLGMRCFVAVVCFCIGFSQFSKVMRGLFAFAVAVFLWVVPNSRFNSELLILLGLAFFVDYIYDTFFNKKTVFVVIRKGLEILALFIAAAIPFIIMWAVVYYEKIDPSIMAKLNDMSSGRLWLAHAAYTDTGFSLWGQYYHGWGIDAGWILIPVTYGIPMMLIVLTLFLYTGFKAYKDDNFLLICVVLLLSLTGLCYELVVHSYYCVFLVVPFAKFVNIKDEHKCIDVRIIDGIKDFLYRNATLICSFITVGLFLIFRKSIISSLQTMIECQSYSSNMSLGIIIVFLILIAVLMIGLSACLKMAIKHEKTISVWLLPVSCIVLCFLFVFCWHSNTSIETNSIAYEPVLADQEAMSIMGTVEGANVVPQSKPYLYKKYYGFTDLKWLPTADYARFDNMTVIVDARTNYRTLSETGFVQTPISDYHKIYTNDSRVIEAMEAAGYTFTSYSQYVKKLKLDQYADLNGLEQAQDGSILVKASEDGLVISKKMSEDFVDIYNEEGCTADANGNYNMHIVVQADTDELENLPGETVVAHILLQTSFATFLDYRITASEFDDGVAVCDIPFWMGVSYGSRINTTFTIDEAYTIDFSIKEISYYRTE